MEPLLPAWVQEIARAGFGYILFLAALVILWRKDRELAACQEQGRADAIKMAVALEQTAKVVGEANEVQRQQIETSKLEAGVIQALTKQIDIGEERARERDDRARERAQTIMDAVNRRGGGGVRGT
jgi:hypothetical protein